MRFPCMVSIWAPIPIHKMTTKAEMEPITTPLVFAQGKNIPNENIPNVIPPIMPLKLIAACAYIPINYSYALLTYYITLP